MATCAEAGQRGLKLGLLPTLPDAPAKEAEDPDEGKRGEVRGRESHRESGRTALSNAVQMLSACKVPPGGPLLAARINLSQLGFQPLLWMF